MRRNRRCTACAIHAAEPLNPKQDTTPKPAINKGEELTHCSPSKVYVNRRGTFRRNIRRDSILRS